MTTYGLPVVAVGLDERVLRRRLEGSVVKPRVPLRVDLGHIASEALRVLDPPLAVAGVVPVVVILKVPVAIPVSSDQLSHGNVVVKRQLAERLPPPEGVHALEGSEEGHRRCRGGVETTVSRRAVASRLLPGEISNGT